MLKIALLSSINQGGIVQFTFEMYKQLSVLGHSVVCVVPEKAAVNKDEIFKKKNYLYTRDCYKNAISAGISEIQKVNKDVKKVAGYLTNQPFDIIMTTDTSSFTIKVCSYLKQLKVNSRIVISIHDAVPHPTYNLSFKAKFTYYVGKYYREKGLYAADYFMFFSQKCKDQFENVYPNIKTTKIILPLGAHVPDVKAKAPLEIGDKTRFFLFFGRLEKYKGIETFLKAFSETREIGTPFVIAGSGVLTEDEQSLVEKDNRVILIKRFISDEEMIWLISHAKALVLPYIEASQSGVIPIAYKYGIPVITSDVEGLTQFVDDGNTGIICKNHDAYIKAIHVMEEKKSHDDMAQKARIYYENNLDWEKNIKNIVEVLRETRR